jgi:hypothetical protein
MRLYMALNGAYVQPSSILAFDTIAQIAPGGDAQALVHCDFGSQLRAIKFDIRCVQKHCRFSLLFVKTSIQPPNIPPNNLHGVGMAELSLIVLLQHRSRFLRRKLGASHWRCPHSMPDDVVA